MSYSPYPDPEDSTHRVQRAVLFTHLWGLSHLSEGRGLHDSLAEASGQQQMENVIEDGSPLANV